MINRFLFSFCIEPPQRLWVVHENGTRVAMASIGSNTSKNIGPYYVGDTIHLVCVAYEGKKIFVYNIVMQMYQVL